MTFTQKSLPAVQETPVRSLWGRSPGERIGYPFQYFWASLVDQLVKNPPAMWGDSWVGKITWRRKRLPIPVFLGLPCGSAGKESACNAGRFLGWEDRLEKEKATHSSILARSTPWTVNGVAKS